MMKILTLFLLLESTLSQSLRQGRKLEDLGPPPEIVLTSESGIPQDLPSSCAAILCLAPSDCIEVDGVAQCVPIALPAEIPPQNSTCAAIICPALSDCIEEDGVARCVPIDVCKDFVCEVEGEVCFPLDVVCITAPCLPIPTCTENFCATVRCGSGTTCSIDGEGNAVCLPDDVPTSCDDLICIATTTCEVIDGVAQCVPIPVFEEFPVGSSCAAISCLAPSDCIEVDGVAQCVPIALPIEFPPQNSTCAAILCPASSDCVEEDGVARCVPIDVCQDFVCEGGQICVPQDVVCVTAPCPPVPACIDDVCARVRCPGGTTCSVDKEGNAVCLPDDPPTKCNDLICIATTTCEVVDGVAQCVPIAPFPPQNSTCAAIICPAPSDCIEEDGVARCVPIDVCKDFVCEVEGEVCFPLDVVCITAPCLPIPTCTENSCATVRCGSGTTCSIDGEGNAVCLPPKPRPCSTLECPVGEECMVLDLITGDEGCVPSNPCATIDCKPGDVCQPDSLGNAFCAPPIAVPGEGDPESVDGRPTLEIQNTDRSGDCSTLECDTGSVCEINKKGVAVCAFPLPTWWERIQDEYDGFRLKRCKLRLDEPPNDGDKCAPLAKTCYFGTQDCPGVGPSPVTRCDCAGRVWSCSNEVCPDTNAP